MRTILRYGYVVVPLLLWSVRRETVERMSQPLGPATVREEDASGSMLNHIQGSIHDQLLIPLNRTLNMIEHSQNYIRGEKTREYSHAKQEAGLRQALTAQLIVGQPEPSQISEIP